MSQHTLPRGRFFYAKTDSYRTTNVYIKTFDSLPIIKRTLAISSVY